MAEQGRAANGPAAKLHRVATRARRSRRFFFMSFGFLFFIFIFFFFNFDMFSWLT